MSYIRDALNKAQKENNVVRMAPTNMNDIVCLSQPRTTKSRMFRIPLLMLLLVLLALDITLLVINQTEPDSQNSSLSAKKDIPLPARKEDIPAQANISENKHALAAQNMTEEQKSLDSIRSSINKNENPSIQTIRLYQAALKLQRNNSLWQAENIYRQVLQREPNNVYAMNNLGVIYMGQKKTDEAMVLFRKAAEIKKDYFHPYYNLACIYAQKNDINASVNYLKQAVLLNKDVKDWVAEDADLKNIRQTPQFKKILEEKS